MKNRLKFGGIVIVAIFVLLVACQKTSPSPAKVSSNSNSSTNTTTSVSSFQWQENGGALINADSAYWSYSGPNSCATLFAFKNGVQKISLFLGQCSSNSLSSGNKFIDPQAFGFNFNDLQGNYLLSDGRAYNITVGNANSIDGNFDFPVHLQGSNVVTSITSVQATFSNIPFKP